MPRVPNKIFDSIVPLTINGRIAIVHLSTGEHAIIDAEDWPIASKGMWSVTGGKSKTRTRYAYRRNDTEGVVLLHRAIIRVTPDQQVDHINRNAFDNRRCNLRLCTSSQNMWNRKPYRSRRIKGVYETRPGSKKPWRAAICKDRKQISLGVFYSEADAAKAYDDAASRLFGEFAYLNGGTNA